jgi:hypothetical protein
MGVSVPLKTHKHTPESLKPFFWDVDFEVLSVGDFSHFVISRLMEHAKAGIQTFLLDSR